MFVRNAGSPPSGRALGVLALSVFGGCAAAADEGTSAASTTTVTAAPTAPTSSTLPAVELPAGVDVFVEFPRYLQLQRRLEVGFDNRSDHELIIESVGLRSVLFEPVELDQPSTEIEIGRRRDLQMGLGAAVCPALDGPVQVEVVAEIDGVRQHGLVDVPAAPLEQISATECGRVFVYEQVDIGYAPEFTVRDGVLATQLVVDRVDGDEPIEVSNVRGSVLLELSPAADDLPLGTLAPGEDALAVPVQLRVIRCDPHAVIESKKTFQLAVWVAVGSRETQHLVVPPEGELRAALEVLIDECLRGESAG